MDPNLNLPPANSPFGHSLRQYWSLEPGIHFLNHGSYGAAPRYVQAAQQRWRDEMESEPVRFMADILPRALRDAGARLAKFLGATPSNLAFVENATQGINAVLRSQRWNAGDRVVLANHAYPAVKNTVRFLAERHGLTVVEAQVPWPLPNAQALVDAYAQALAGGARIVIFDHIFSPLAVITPIEQLIAVCRVQGTQVIIDGAHAPAMLPLDLDAIAKLGVDWYAGNCHKWLCAPKGVGFLYASIEGQGDLHPTVISNYYGGGFEAEFAWTGTGDPSARLSVPAAIDFIEALGVERYRAALRSGMREAAACIAEGWKVQPGAPLEMCGSMVSFPLPVNEVATPESVAKWRLMFLREHNVEAPVFPINGQLWMRVSAQVYNERSDVEALAGVFG
jgi:isopenicillin-N epimerase